MYNYVVLHRKGIGFLNIGKIPEGETSCLRELIGF